LRDNLSVPSPGGESQEYPKEGTDNLSRNV
jgi:hypothetical protein